MKRNLSTRYKKLVSSRSTSPEQSPLASPRHQLQESETRSGMSTGQTGEVNDAEPSGFRWDPQPLDMGSHVGLDLKSTDHEILHGLDLAIGDVVVRKDACEL